MTSVPAARTAAKRQKSRNETARPYSLQQYLWQDPDKASRGWGPFAQAAISDGNPNPVAGSVFVGFGGATPFTGHLDDRWGVSWFGYFLSHDLRNSFQALGGDIRDEKGLEAYYDFALADHVRVGPDAQAIWPATASKPAAVFVGARARIVF